MQVGRRREHALSRRETRRSGGQHDKAGPARLPVFRHPLRIQRRKCRNAITLTMASHAKPLENPKENGRTKSCEPGITLAFLRSHEGLHRSV